MTMADKKPKPRPTKLDEPIVQVVTGLPDGGHEHPALGKVENGMEVTTDLVLPWLKPTSGKKKKSKPQESEPEADEPKAENKTTKKKEG